MKLIPPSVQFLGITPTGYNGVLEHIEIAGRTCYKSEDKISNDSADKFVRKLINAGHLAMVEHSNFVVMKDVFGLDWEDFVSLDNKIGKYLNHVIEGDTLFIGGSLTAWSNQVNHMLLGMACVADSLFEPFIIRYGDLFGVYEEVDNLEWKVCPHENIPKSLHRYSVKFICDRGVGHEIVRHRPCSFAQESTRYVNYGDKDMEFIEPAGYDKWSKHQKYLLNDACAYAQIAYNDLLDEGFKPQQARAVLLNALKTEIIVTADAAEWRHIKKLRTHPSAHPDMVRIMNMVPWEDII